MKLFIDLNVINCEYKCFECNYLLIQIELIVIINVSNESICN